MARFIAIIATLLLGSCDMGPQVHHVTPPNLDDDHLGKRIVGYRPWRASQPNMSVEVVDGKVLAHNYGHGGAGWTIAPGSTSYLYSLLESSSLVEELSNDAPITVVGFGAIGMFTAYHLIKKGHSRITIISDKEFEETVSSIAGGIWEPAFVSDDQLYIEEMIVDSYRFYKEVIDGRNSDLDGVTVTPLYAGSRHVFPRLVRQKVIPEPRKVIVDFGNGVRRDLYFYPDNIGMNPHRIAASMKRFLEDAGVEFERRTITGFTEVDSKLIFNCTGMGSLILNQDNKLLPLQGHLIELIDQEPEVGRFFFSASKSAIGVSTGRQRVDRGTMYYPTPHGENVGLIGWTAVWGGDENSPNTDEFDLIIARTREFFTGK